MASSIRAPRGRKLSPSASYSDSCQPTPTPRRMRPPESVSSVLTCLATSAGCRWGSTSTSVPRGRRASLDWPAHHHVVEDIDVVVADPLDGAGEIGDRGRPLAIGHAGKLDAELHALASL